MVTIEMQKEITRYIQSEFYNIFGDSYNALLVKQYIEGSLDFTIHFTPKMLCDLMDYYLLYKTEMAICMGVSIDCFNSLLKLQHDLPKSFQTRIGYASIILILGTRKYGKNRFLKWYPYYLQKHDILAPISSFVYMEIVKLLSLPGQVSISYYWKELIPPKVIELPSYFNA
jgi:hypothetical protein